MSYPQKAASRAVIGGQDFYRLYTELESPGDIYEIDVSAQAFVIGPQSDVARVRVSYYDPESNVRIASFVVSVDDPFLGRVDALSSSEYPIQKAPAKILVSLEDIINNDFQPGAKVPNDQVSFIRPRVDLQAYLAPVPTFAQKRADFFQRGKLTVPVVNIGPGTGTSFIVAPYYRRKYASLKFLNFVNSAYALTVRGITFIPGVKDKFYSKTLINAGVITASGGTTATSEFVIKASADGLHDYLDISVFGPAVDGSANPSLFYDISFLDEET